MATCAACGRERADDARFCSACGAPIAARAAAREERKVVTRGDVAGAFADASSALSAARRAKDPQALAPPLSFAARIHTHEGRLDEAARHVDELVALTLGGFDPGHDWPDLIEALLGLGRRDELATLLESFRETGWTAATRLHAAGDPAAAADMYEQIGARPDEAHARLSAAKVLAAAGRRAEADEQLTQALGFFRSVGAARYVREGETLLAATG